MTTWNNVLKLQKRAFGGNEVECSAWSPG